MLGRLIPCLGRVDAGGRKPLTQLQKSSILGMGAFSQRERLTSMMKIMKGVTKLRATWGTMTTIVGAASRSRSVLHPRPKDGEGPCAFILGRGAR